MKNREKVRVPVVCGEGALPFYGSEEAAGADLRAELPKPVSIPPGGYRMVPTGLRLEIPAGFEGQVRPRSGLAARRGITILNTPGTIDSDYRGEVKVLLVNFGDETFMVEPGERIAQIVIAPVIRAEFRRVEELEATERGRGGFGSTGTE